MSEGGLELGTFCSRERYLNRSATAPRLTGTVKSCPLQGEVHYKGCLLLRGGSTIRLECLVLGNFLEYLPPSSKRSPILMVVFFLFFPWKSRSLLERHLRSIFFFCLLLTTHPKAAKITTIATCFHMINPLNLLSC